MKPKGVGTNNGIQVILVGDLDPKVEEQVKGLGLKTDKITGAARPLSPKRLTGTTPG
ncbi:hypothetical protein [Paenibacillus tyrfis]|uniref:hypothetical protein n=1 Tax=Paenibacillus tyrfis TaxID=1501230 RepID=UPI00209EDC69|nr:hypothetical protein [Paenibacillus tyrfis]MCP1307471.1 hypothetical protein [Paenibacillus tyrfis]